MIEYFSNCMTRELGKKIIELLVTSKLLSFSGNTVRMIVEYALAINNAGVVRYSDKDRSKVMKLVKKIKEEVKLLMEFSEAYQIFMAVKNTSKIEGDIAEVGVYKGGSAKIISEIKGNKSLYLFDTWDGLPEISKNDEKGYFKKGEFQASLESVKRYLKKYSKVHFYKGYFPNTAKPILNKKFSFVNLDVDIYESTKSSLEFFYPRMSKGGIIISHDYINAIGVRKAIDDFFQNKPEPIVEMAGSQCLIVKL